MGIIKMQTLTIVICTYNRSFFLEKCLESLLRQTVSLDTFNVLIIDNNSTDDTQEMAESFQDKFPHFEIIFEPNQGLSYAKNTGAAKASTEWVAFLDDDGEAHSNWVEKIFETIAKNEYDAFGGIYLALYRFRERPKWFLQSWDSSAGGYVGGNAVFLRAAVIAAGGFPTDKGMVGNKIAYGEETVLFLNLQKQGKRIGMVHDLIVDHHTQLYKYSLWWSIKSSYRSARDSFSIFKIKSLHTFSRLFFGLIYKILVLPFTVLYRFAFRKEYFWQNAVLDCCRPIASILGSMVGFFKMKGKKNTEK